MRREIRAQRELIQARKNRKKGLRLQSGKQFLYSTRESLEITRKAEEETAKKKTKRQPKRRGFPKQVDGNEDNVQESDISDSGSSCITVLARTE